jgi:hypothetical protein
MDRDVMNAEPGLVSDSILDQMAGRQLPQAVAAFRDRLRPLCRRALVAWLTDEETGEPVEPAAFAVSLVVPTERGDVGWTTSVTEALIEDSAMDPAAMLVQQVQRWADLDEAEAGR